MYRRIKDTKTDEIWMEELNITLNCMLVLNKRDNKNHKNELKKTIMMI